MCSTCRQIGHLVRPITLVILPGSRATQKLPLRFLVSRMADYPTGKRVLAPGNTSLPLRIRNAAFNRLGPEWIFCQFMNFLRTRKIACALSNRWTSNPIAITGRSMYRSSDCPMPTAFRPLCAVSRSLDRHSPAAQREDRPRPRCHPLEGWDRR